jgi:ribulose-phosphate 3-epimerase
MPKELEKVTEVRSMLEDVHSPSRLEVDGGVSSSNIASLHQAGADTFVSASAIFGHPDGIAAGVAALRKALAHT